MKIYWERWAENSACAVRVDLRYLPESTEFIDFFSGNVLVLIFSSKEERSEFGVHSEHRKAGEVAQLPKISSHLHTL